MEPVVTLAFNVGHGLLAGIDGLVSGTHWGQVAANHLRERVNMTHVVLSLPAILFATFLVGIPLNHALGERCKRTGIGVQCRQRRLHRGGEVAQSRA